jgi:hypothetical protein
LAECTNKISKKVCENIGFEENNRIAYKNFIADDTGIKYFEKAEELCDEKFSTLMSLDLN